ncbi:hypothetical protein BDN72DRAFT_847639 [Pluteus cervinus]|uniref:Uncharacterized protein n=1 Tax=Pluteus cervinus TaxID=181527 RepID=A0ACD3AF05_9AGAR|nr:hypothetical protein BDN72DRAFT_847639 [Pluteus cervinus]
MSSIQAKITAVESAIIKKPPFCTGHVQINERSSTLFYKTDDASNAKFLSLTSATTDDLQKLTNACLPAKFGLGQEDVLDESYRKARKMDIDNFMVGFDPSTIVDVIRQELLDSEDVQAALEVELYKLNVYDKGSFFKAHRDTPRRRDMFASLVIVFPTPHEGGKLLLRHDTEEWAFDSTQVLAGTQTPSAAFIAFYSDVEHEVTTVEAGHRVTLTYNIYRGGLDPEDNNKFVANKAEIGSGPSGAGNLKGIPHIQSARKPSASLLKANITNLLLAPTCLPRGGYFGFGLRFMYPAFGGKEFDLQEMMKQLKGSDAIIKQVCAALKLKTALRLYAHTKYSDGFLLSKPVDLSDCGEVEDVDRAFREMGAEQIKVVDWDNTRNSTKPRIMWLSPKTEYVSYESVYMAYGNEASLGNIYGHVCLVAKVGRFGHRET